MLKSRHLLIIFLLWLSPTILSAQENELRTGLRTGHNAAFGRFTAISLETLQYFSDDISLSGGLQYNSIGKSTLEVRPDYHMHLDWGTISAEALFHYSNMASINIFAAGVGIGLSFDRIDAKLGYYYRNYGSKGGWIAEPFNLYYELRIHFLQKIEDWDLQLAITNNETFELERHYQPSFIAEGFYNLNSKFGLSFGIGCKPAGMFNMSADYYQTFLKTGVCYRW